VLACGLEFKFLAFRRVMLKYFMHTNVLCLKFKVHSFVGFKFKLTTLLGPVHLWVQMVTP
jgi:hypothetical protein